MLQKKPGRAASGLLLPHPVEDADEPFQVGPGQPAEAWALDLVERPVRGGEHVEARARDPAQPLAAVLPASLARDEPARLDAVQEPRHARLALDEPGRDLERGQLPRVRAAKG